MNDKKEKHIFIKNKNRETVPVPPAQAAWKSKNIEPVDVVKSKDFNIISKRFPIEMPVKKTYVPMQSFIPDENPAKDFDFDEIPDPPKNEPVQQNEMNFNYSAIEAGQYVVLVDNKILYSSSNKNELEKYLTELFINNDSVEPVVIHRMNINIGVSLG